MVQSIAFARDAQETRRRTDDVPGKSRPNGKLENGQMSRDEPAERGEREHRPSPIDVHVGGRVRLRRTLLGMSQEKLGEALGLTFQQVQKYERGVNRIGASRLFDIARVLDVPIGFFFDDMPDGVGGGSRTRLRSATCADRCNCRPGRTRHTSRTARSCSQWRTLANDTRTFQLPPSRRWRA